MTGILSRAVPAFDITAASFQGAARDVGEVVAYLAGGIRPNPDTQSRLSISLRTLQGFLLEEARQQSAREAISCHEPGLAQGFQPVTLSLPRQDQGGELRAWPRDLRASK